MADCTDRQVTIDLIDRQKLLKDIEQYHLSDGFFQHWVEVQQSVDAVKVVRCGDCKHYQFADNRAFGFPVKRCEWTRFEDVDDDDFCSRGERKDE